MRHSPRPLALAGHPLTAPPRARGHPRARAAPAAAPERAGFLLPLISPVRQAKDGTYLERLEARRAAYQPTEDASPGARSVRSYMRSSWGVL